jgi:ubiquinone/menaquinone biosynthesis C-methylase UbiE
MLGDFSDPKKVIKNIGLRKGMTVADIGTGSGFYTFASAEEVGPEGKVYSIEVQKEIVGRVKKEAVEQGFKNVEVLWANAENVGGTHLAKESIDVVIVSNTLFQMANKTSFAQEAYRITKPGGTMALIDWSESFNGLGPHSGYVVTKEEGKMLFEGYGFVFQTDFDAGAHHWGIILKRE